MGTLTSKLRLFKPATVDNVLVQDDLNANFDLLDEKVPVLICTSGTRPTGTSLYAGRQIYETDTGNSLTYDGSAWQNNNQYLPGTYRRMGVSILSGDSAEITTTETAIQTLSNVSVSSGKKFEIVWDGHGYATVSGAVFVIGLRETSATGTLLKAVAFQFPVLNQGYPIHVAYEFTASSTTTKTYVVTLNRSSASGGARAQADSRLVVNRIY